MGLGCPIMGEPSPSVPRSRWMGPSSKDAAVRVAVERETEARSWAGACTQGSGSPRSCPATSLVSMGRFLGTKLPHPGGAGAEPRGWGGCRAPPALPVLPGLSQLHPPCPSEGLWKNQNILQAFPGFFPTEQPQREPQLPGGVPWAGVVCCKPLPLPQPEHFVAGMKGLPLSIPSGDRFWPKPPPLPSR